MIALAGMEKTDGRHSGITIPGAKAKMGVHGIGKNLSRYCRRNGGTVGIDHFRNPTEMVDRRHQIEAKTFCKTADGRGIQPELREFYRPTLGKQGFVV